MKQKLNSESLKSQHFREKKVRKRIKSASKHLQSSVKPKTKAATLEITDDSDEERPLSLGLKRRKHDTDSDDECSTVKRKTAKQAAVSVESLFSDDSSPKRTTTAEPSSRVPQTKPQLPRRSLPTASHSIASGSGSGISTKRRLAEKALTPILPNAALGAGQKPRPHTLPSIKTNSSNLVPLSFKKKPPPLGGEVTRTPVDNMKTSDSVLDEQNSVMGVPGSPVFNKNFSPDAALPKLPNTFLCDTSSSIGRAIAVSPISTPTLANDLQRQAEIFLQENMPPPLAAPLTPATESPYEPTPPRSLIQKKLVPPEKIPKKWTWSGSVFIDADLSRPVFDVTFCDVTDPVPNSARFSVVLDGSEKLDFSTFHDVVDLPIFTGACTEPLQFARVVPNGNKDIEAFEIFSTYMARNQKIILTSLYLDKKVIGHILFFPQNQAICNRLHVPSSVYYPKTGMLTFLIAALLPWKLTIPPQSFRPPSCFDLDVRQDLFLDKSRWERSLRLRPAYQHALRILQFPVGLHKFMSEPNHSFDVWWDGGDGTKKQAGVETYMLFSVMEQCRSKRVVFEPRGNIKTSDPRLTSDHRNPAEPRVMFIHVGAVKTIRNLPGLLEFSSRALTQFWTYGTHRSVASEHWGVREVYPCGGIVTFTPEAILSDYIDVLPKIQKICGHPMWACYIIPSVLGMIAKDEGNDPLAMFDSGQFPFHGLLASIDEGKLAVLSAPPSDSYNVGRNNLTETWLRNYWTHRPQDPRSILQFCCAAFNSKYANINKMNWSAAVKGEISKDLSCMRQQPKLMADYRRYVVICSDGDKRIHRDDGLEWTTIKKFDFKDDFHT